MTTTTIKFCAEQSNVGSCSASCCGPHTCTEELLNHTERVHRCECGRMWGPAMARTSTIDDDCMWSEHVAAHANRVHNVEGDKCWKVSWLPQRMFDRNQAITAMLIADGVALGGSLTGVAELANRGFLGSLCAELGLDTEDAIRMVRVDQACTSGFVTLSVADAESGEWQRIRHGRVERVDEPLLLRVLNQSLDPGDLAEFDKPVGMADVQHGGCIRVQLVDAFGTPAVDFTATVKW